MGTNTTNAPGGTQTTTVNGPNAGPATFVPAPANSSAAGQPLQIATDGTYLFVCVAANQWKRLTLEVY